MVLDNLNLNFFIHYKYFHCWCPKTMKNHPRWQGLWLGCCKYNVKGCCSVTQLCPTLWDPLNWSTPGFPVLHYLLEFAQTHIHWVDDAIQSSYPLSPHSPPPPLSSESGSLPISWLFPSGGWSIGASALVSVLPKNIQGWFPLGLTDLISLLSKGLSRVFSSTTLNHHYWDLCIL